MADLKISQLTGATTPLAGTEVLPVVQSGTTKQVSVANLTAGRSVATGPLAVSGPGNVSMSLSATSAGSPNFYIAPTGGGNAILSWTTGQALRLATADNASLGGFVERVKVDGSGNTTPGADNTQTLGSSGNRWSVVYAGTGTINTSDAREKTQREIGIDPAVLRAWSKVQYSQFKFNDAVEKKGDSARWHFGLIAQQVKEAFESEGLNAFDYGLLCYDEWSDQYEEVWKIETVIEDGKEKQISFPTGEQRLVVKAGNRYGIRYEEALALECAYLRSIKC
jgi:hypothetical protein